MFSKLSLLLLCLFLFANFCFSQDRLQKKFYGSEGYPSGNGQLKKAILKKDNNKSCKTFEIKVNRKTKYFLSAWVLGTKKNQTDNKIQVFINNNNKSIGSLQINNTG